MDYFRSKRFLDTLKDWETGNVPPGPVEHYMPRMRALLDRLDRPQERFRSIIVGGTNGKGTVSSLLAALLRASGKRVGLYGSPHLHTVRERIQIDGQVLEKAVWAEGVTELYERSRLFEKEGFGAFTRFEALTALAVHLFAQADVEYGVFEVGLGGRYDATNAWDSELAVLTPVGLDHTAVLGETLEEIAAEKFEISRSGRPLFTALQAPEVRAFLQAQSAERGVDLREVDGAEIAGPLLDRPATYIENAGLALVATQAVLGEELDQELARETVATYVGPGRFEVVRKEPWLVLDGAHNPPGISRLVEDLRRVSKQWTFVVGVNGGHDAAGILEALRPLAGEVVLTQSMHAKAHSVDQLRQQLPEGVVVRCEPDVVGLMAKLAEAEGPVCVTGSLYLVAQAREALNLPFERDGFSEDVQQESLTCLEIACGNLDLSLELVSENGNLFRCPGVDGRPVYFMRNKHPFNDYVSARLAEDKAYQYEIFLQAGLLVPYTVQVFNPLADARFDRYQTHRSIESIVEDVEREFTYPVVIKRNRGSLAQGVFLEEDRAGLEARLGELCENSGYFDNVLLIQAYVAGPEDRIVASRDEMLLAYEKVSEPVEGQRLDMNPLHQVTGRAVRVEDPKLLEAMETVVQGISGVIDLGFYAIDLILSDAGFYILEINPNPICYFFNMHNGRRDFVRIYERLLRKYVLGTEVPGIRVASGEKR